MESSTSTSPQVVYDGAVTRVDLDAWNSDLEELFTRMGPVFYRTEALVSFSWVRFRAEFGRHTVPCRVSGCRGQDHRDRERCARIQGMAEGPSCRTDDG